MDAMHVVDVLREDGRITWIEEYCGWTASSENVVSALTRDGFEECKRALGQASG